MRRTVIGIFALLLLTLLAPYRAGALGLGDIKLSSYLNQPLKARIGLLPSQAGELDDAKITLAPNDAFERAGIERRDVLSQLDFQVVKGPDGRPYIQVTSQDPIKEPFLDFILQVTWPKGRLLREYTVLLDPPVTTEESAPPIQPAESATTAPAEASAPSPAPAAEPVTGNAAVASGPVPAGVPTRSIDAKLTKDSYGPTQRTDTLWSIAKSVRPDRSVTIQQVMLALVKNNPDAFYRGNVNTLKAGYVLRLPDLALINQVDQADALREVKRQYRQWQDIKAGKVPATAGPAPANTSPSNQAAATGGATAPAPAKTDEQARLKLLPPDAGQTAAGVTGGTAAAGKSTQDRLASALEANEAQQQENASLRARINELNDQVQSMKRLLALKDDTLSVLQSKLGQTQQQGTAAGQTAAPTPPAATASQPAQPQPAPAAKSAAPPPPTVVKPPAHAAPRPQEGGGLFSDPKVLGMGGAAVLLVGTLGWLAMRRRKLKTEALMPEETAEEEAGETADSEEKTVQTEAYSPTGGDLLEAEVNEIDPLAEADVYMAYRRYQQAEELLKGAIDQEPNRQELRLKLLEVYAAAENADAFTAEAENFYNEYDGRDNPLWQKVASMGRDVSPSHPLFSGDGDDAVGGEESQAQDQTQTDAPAAEEGDAISEFSVDVEPLAMDDGVETVPSADEQAPAQPADMTEDELTFLSGEQTDDALDNTLDLDAQQPADESVPEGSDAVQGETEEASEAEDESFSLEFEPGLDKVVSDQGSESPSQDEAEPFKTGNEIDFDTMAVTDEKDAVGHDEGRDQEQTVEAAADESVDDGLDDTFELDTVDGLDDVEQTADTDSGLTFVEDNKGEGDGLAAVAEDGAAEQSEPSAGDHDDEQGAGKLDFDFDLGGSLATKDKDLDDFFEGLDSGDEGQEEAGGHEEVGTKLDLAKAFIEMGDQDGAKDILKEVVDNGDDDQKQEAQGLLQQLDA